MKKILVAILIICGHFNIALSQTPANDNCGTAINLGTLPTPGACVSGLQNGAPVTLNNQSTVGATAANPYLYQTGCQGGGVQQAPALDTWYSFTASGYIANITITGFPNASVALWSGNCNSLQPFGCTNIPNGGTGTLTQFQLTIGQTYLIQVSGGSTSATDNSFSIAVDNDIDCNNCLTTGILTANPPPVNGGYNAGQVVQFCYTVNGWTQVNTNWFHGVQITMGSGWTGTISNPVPAATLQNIPGPGSDGAWLFYPTGIGSVNGTNWGPGFYFDTPDAGTSANDNYGDNCGGSGCTWTFCWNLTVSSNCVPGMNLNVSVNTSGDGESGSWTNLACQGDNPTNFSAIGICCTPPPVPTITTIPATCLAAGTATITNYVSTQTYTFTPAGPTAGAGGAISGMTPGTSYTVTAGNGSCTSAASAAFSIAAQLITPPVPTITTTAATCLGNGTATITNYVSTQTYTFTPAGPTAGAGGAISGMTPGTSYTVTAGNGSCTSAASAAFSIAAQLITPAVPTITTTPATCLAAGTATITNYVSTQTYTFTPTGPTAGAGGAISGMTPGTSYTVTAGNGSCTSAASAAFSIGAQLITPAVPTITTTAATCLGNGTATITNYVSTQTYTFTPTGPTAGAGGAISGMTPGTSYTITAGNGSCTSAASAAFSIAAQLITPAVPTTSAVPATCLAAGTATITNYVSTQTYTFTPAGPTAGAGGAISGMTPGTSYTVTAGNGSCTSAASAAFSIAAQLITPAVPTITTTAATCLGNGTATITNYVSTQTYTFTPAGPTAGAGGAISGMTPGTSYTVTAGNGSCTSAASAAFSIAAQLITPAVPTITTTPATCLAAGTATISNYVSTQTYTFTPTGPTAGAGGAISGMTPGTSYTVTAGNGSCTSVASAAFSIAAQLITPAVPTITTTAATCLGNGTATITNYVSTQTYTFTPTGPTAGAGGAISGMTPGTSYTVTAGNGSCTSAASAAFSIAAQLITPPVPTITTTPATCLAAGTATITNYVSTQTYTFTPAGPTAGAGGAISGMTPGTSYTVTAGNGSCTSAASAAFSIAAQLITPAVPTITTTPATCLAAGTATISNYVSTQTYTFTPTGPTAGAGGAISGMTPGTSYTVTAGNGSCTSAASAAFSIAAQLITPAVPTITTTAATCLGNGTATITNYVSTQTYTFTPAGPTAGAGGAISGMTPGTSYTVTAGNGSCTSAASAAFSIAAQLITPPVPTITTTAATCLGNGTATITNYVSTQTYTFTPAGPTAGAGGAISGMTPGTSYTVTAGNGSCTSAASAAFSIAAQLITPAVPTITTTPATCLAAGTATISNYVSTQTYTFTPAGPTAGAGGAISGMTPGTSYTVTTSNGVCTSAASAAFSIGAQLITPAVPTITTTAATCLGNGTATITNYVSTQTYTFTPTGPTAGAGGAISGMTPGTSYTVTAGNGSCTSAASAAFSIAAQLITPAVPTTSAVPATCLADGSASITNYVSTQTYTFTPAGPTAGAGGAISGMTPGTSYTVTAGNGSCTSAASAAFSIAAQLITPPVPTITTTAATCLGNGTATITNYVSTQTYTFTPAGPTAGAGGAISGMTPGTSYTVTTSNGVCTSAASAAFSIAAQLITPAVPTITTTPAACLADGTATITNYVSTQTYTFTPTGPTAGAGGAISGMTPGTSYTVTAGNGSCTSAASAAFSIAAQLITPAVPTITTTAATCLGNGTATITNYVSTQTYTFTPAGPTAGAGGAISGMTPGTSYTVTAGNGSCTSAASAAFSIAAQLITPAVPTITTTPATCLAAGTATITNYVSTQTYTFTPTGPTAGAGGAISGMTPGTSYTVTAGNGSCTSAASAAFSIAAQLITPAVPTITTTAATCLGNGTATITNYVSTQTYTFTPTGPTAGAGGAISGMTPGTSYTVTAGNGSCTSAASAAFSIAAQLITPPVPTTSAVPATCLAAGTATITNYVSTQTYTFTPAGPTAGAGGAISGMTPGTSYTVTAGNGSCTSAASAAFSIGAQLITPAVPTITTTAATCLGNGTATITNYVSTQTYTFTPAGPTAGAGGAISGMTPGTSYTVTAGNGSCTSAASAAFSIAAQLITPAVPTITTTPATCLAAGTATISNYVSTQTYTFTPTGPTAGAGGAISGMTPGTSYTVTAGNGSCTSVASAAFSIAAQLITPAVPTITTTAATCLGNGTATITNYVSTQTYTFTPAGPTAGAGGAISGMTPGTSYTVTAGNGSCTSAASAAFSIAAQLITPAVPTITTTPATCLAAGTATISNYVSTQTYTFTPAGPTAGAGGAISGMTPGTSYTVTTSNGVCTSAASAAFSIAAQLITPAVPTITTTAATCLGNGTATITNYVSTQTYTFTPTGPTAGAGGAISGMTPGTSYTVTAGNGSCTSAASAAFSIAAQLITPAVPTITTTPATCLAAGTATISNYVSTQTYTFTPTGPTVGAGGAISGMTPGTSYTVTAGNGSCTSAASAAFSIAAQLITPAVPTITTTAATCLGNGTATITNYVSTQTYTFTPTGPTAGAGGAISGMTPGTSYTVTAGNGSCTSAASAAFSIAAQLITPPVPTTSAVPATCLADGSASITNYVSTQTYTFTPTGPTVGAGGAISGMTPGTSYTVTTSNGICTSAASAAFSIAVKLITPAVPTITTTAATCLGNGTATITNYVSTQTYTFTPTGPTAGAGGAISGMTPGTSYTVTAGNGSCTSAASAAFSIELQLPFVAPLFTVDSAGGCAPLTATLSTTDLQGFQYQWSANGNTIGTGSSLTSTYNDPGCYDITLTVINSIGCVASSTINNMICVEDIPEALFAANPSLLVSNSQNVFFLNNSIGATNYYWDFGDGQNSSLENPNHFYDAIDGNIEVTLTAISSFGCIDQYTVVLNFQEEAILYVPNAFTPDGDEFNNNWGPVFTQGFDPYNFELYIFDRWGEIIWESHDAEARWDGTYGMNGIKCQDGVYVWKIIYKSKENDQKVELTGHVNLLR